MKDIVFITFDIPRTDYPAMTYSMASIFTTLKANNYKCSHFPIDVKQVMQDGVSGEKLTSIVKSKLSTGLQFFKGFRYIAISVTRWSVEHANSLIDLLDGYEGKIILGGYEITATDNEILLKEYPKADYFRKGYGITLSNRSFAYSDETYRHQLAKLFLLNYKKVKVPAVYNHIHAIISLTESVGATLAVALNRNAVSQNRNDVRAGVNPAPTRVSDIVGAYKSLVGP